MFYDNFVRLCNSVGKSPTAVAEDIGIYRSTVSRWKKGNSLTDANMQKVADYFGVSVEYLTSDHSQGKENGPAIEVAGPNKKELLKLLGDYSDEQCANLLEIIKMIKSI